MKFSRLSFSERLMLSAAVPGVEDDEDAANAMAIPAAAMT
jgi:hypothetical protein